jgi:hypothetical protein
MYRLDDPPSLSPHRGRDKNEDIPDDRWTCLPVSMSQRRAVGARKASGARTLGWSRRNDYRDLARTASISLAAMKNSTLGGYRGLIAHHQSILFLSHFQRRNNGRWLV